MVKQRTKAAVGEFMWQVPLDFPLAGASYLKLAVTDVDDEDVEDQSPRFSIVRGQPRDQFMPPPLGSHGQGHSAGAGHEGTGPSHTGVTPRRDRLGSIDWGVPAAYATTPPAGGSSNSSSSRSGSSGAAAAAARASASRSTSSPTKELSISDTFPKATRRPSTELAAPRTRAPTAAARAPTAAAARPTPPAPVAVPVALAPPLARPAAAVAAPASSTLAPLVQRHSSARLGADPVAVVAEQTDVFLTHNWGADELDRSNHARVQDINRLLAQHGYTTWFDAERMTGDVIQQMTDGIDNTRVVICFITQDYMHKVNTPLQIVDNAKSEFQYALNHKTPAKMIPVVMEPRMSNSTQWRGKVGLVLSQVLHVNMSSNDDVTPASLPFKALCREIDTRLPEARVAEIAAARLILQPPAYVSNESRDEAHPHRDAAEPGAQGSGGDGPPKSDGTGTGMEVGQFLLDESTITIDRSKMLGSGNFADVFAGTWDSRFGKKRVAMKVFRNIASVAQAANDPALKRELEIGRSMKHDNLVAVHGIVQHEQHMCILMDLVDGGSLFSLLMKREVPLSWRQREAMALDVASGMHHLHTANYSGPIVHRDLKSQNVLVNKDSTGEYRCKVADFGLSKATAGTAGNTYGVGTLAWSAPETFHGEFNEATDSFAFGVLLYEVASRVEPFADVSKMEITRCVMARFKFDEDLLELANMDEAAQRKRWAKKNPLAARRPDLTLVTEGCPPALLDAIQQCWGDDPAKRPSFANLRASFAAAATPVAGGVGGVARQPDPLLVQLQQRISSAKLEFTVSKIALSLEMNDLAAVKDVVLLEINKQPPAHAHRQAQPARGGGHRGRLRRGHGHGHGRGGALGVFVPPAERPAGILLNYLLYQLESDLNLGVSKGVSKAGNVPLWSLVKHLAKDYFEVQAERANDPAETARIDACIGQLMGAEGSDGGTHEVMYFATMARLKKIPAHNQYVAQFQSVMDAIRQPRIEQFSTDLFDVYKGGVAIRDKYHAFIKGLADVCKHEFKMAPLKKLYRCLEKIGLRNARQFDASLLTDIVRGTVLIPTGQTEMAIQFLDFFKGCDDNIGGDFASAFYTKIRIVGIKNKWENPAKGGWHCGMVFFYFIEDPNKHVCELQVVYETMENIRKNIPNSAYKEYVCLEFKGGKIPRNGRTFLDLPASPHARLR